MDRNREYFHENNLTKNRWFGILIDEIRQIYSELRSDTLKLSTKGQYSLKAMVDLAVHGEGGLRTISQIAQDTEISETYLEQLFSRLRKAGLVESTRGASGGYRLTRPLEDISVGDILRAGEGDLTPVDCAWTRENIECTNEHSCVIGYVWAKVTDSINQTVDAISLADLKKMHQ